MIEWIVLFYAFSVIACATFFYFFTRHGLRNGVDFTVGDLLVYSVTTLIPLLNFSTLFWLLLKVSLDSDFWGRPLIKGDGK